MTTAQPNSTTSKYQDISVTETDARGHVIVQQNAQDLKEEKSIEVLYKRTRDLMNELSRVDTELHSVMVTIRCDANTMMDRARKKQNERRSTYFFIFIGIMFVAGIDHLFWQHPANEKNK